MVFGRLVEGSRFKRSFSFTWCGGWIANHVEGCAAQHAGLRLSTSESADIAFALRSPSFCSVAIYYVLFASNLILITDRKFLKSEISKNFHFQGRYQCFGRATQVDYSDDCTVCAIRCHDWVHCSAAFLQSLKLLLPIIYLRSVQCYCFPSLLHLLISTPPLYSIKIPLKDHAVSTFKP
jgi:hypothetical protein